MGILCGLTHYAAFNKDKCISLMDNGHYHPTEVVSDKIPALLQPVEKGKALQDDGNFTKPMCSRRN